MVFCVMFIMIVNLFKDSEALESSDEGACVAKIR